MKIVVLLVMLFIELSSSYQKVNDYLYKDATLDNVSNKSAKLYENYDWQQEKGSIEEIADIEWAKKTAPYFVVSTPEQLAGVVYYVNEYGSQLDYNYLELANNINLSGYDWVPMGCLGKEDRAFNGEVNGKGHTISNMRIEVPYENHCAFIAYSTGVYVHDIRFENALVSGGHYTGIVGGEIYISDKWENIYVSGIIKNAYGETGSIIGREAGLTFINCEAVVFNKKENSPLESEEYFSNRLRILDNTPVTEDFTLTLNEDGSVSRNQLVDEDTYRNLCWHVEEGGIQVLQRYADNELTLDSYYMGDKVWLVAFTGQTYTRVSNIVEK